jgi:hypothetical protein
MGNIHGHMILINYHWMIHVAGKIEYTYPYKSRITPWQLASGSWCRPKVKLLKITLTNLHSTITYSKLDMALISLRSFQQACICMYSNRWWYDSIESQAENFVVCWLRLYPLPLALGPINTNVFHPCKFKLLISSIPGLLSQSPTTSAWCTLGPGLSGKSTFSITT